MLASRYAVGGRLGGDTTSFAAWAIAGGSVGGGGWLVRPAGAWLYTEVREGRYSAGKQPQTRINDGPCMGVLLAMV